MDIYKQRINKEYDIFEIDCKYIGSNRVKRWLKKRLRKIARKRLKVLDTMEDFWGSYDITFCSYKDCENTKCRRHQKRLENWKYPVSIGNFKDCEDWEDNEDMLV